MKAGSEAALAAVGRRIGYSFQNPDLLRTALTHATAVVAGRDSYQRFEFLGDRVLGLVVSEMLFAAFPKATEGELSSRLAELVRKETCAEVAGSYGLGDAVMLVAGRARRDTLLTINVLGDVCESVIGAVYLDGGLDAARKFIAAGWAGRMETWPGARSSAKAALQEWAQSKGLPVPRYTIVGRTGPDHEPHFDIETAVRSFEPARGQGRTRREAEQAAAAAFLVREGIWSAKA
jgi:ribonuclease III